jgi:hypothetical protein
VRALLGRGHAWVIMPWAAVSLRFSPAAASPSLHPLCPQDLPVLPTPSVFAPPSLQLHHMMSWLLWNLAFPPFTLAPLSATPCPRCSQKLDGPYDSRVLPVILTVVLMTFLSIVFVGSIASYEE